MINVLIVGSSRPECLKSGFESITRDLITTDEYQFLYHEDVIDHMKSMDSIRFGVMDRRFKKVMASHPRVGQVDATNSLLPFVKSKYLVYWEEDWVLKEPVKLDKLIRLMDINPYINQIAFPKTTLGNGQIHKEAVTRTFGKMKLTTTHRWVSMPSIWRTSFILPKWKEAYEKYQYNHAVVCTIDHFWICRALNDGHQNIGPLVNVIELGSYFLGERGSKAMIEHTGKVSAKGGNGRRMVPWKGKL